MKLIVVNPQQRYEYEIEWLEAVTSSGSLIIQEGHAPIIVNLVAGSDLSFVYSLTGEKKIIKLIRPGFLEVNRQTVVALITQGTAL